MSITKAAKEFGVPRQTLDDHIKNPSLSSTKGPVTQLTTDEMQGFVNFSLYCAGQGFPMTRKTARCYIREIVRRSGKFNVGKYNIYI